MQLTRQIVASKEEEEKKEKTALINTNYRTVRACSTAGRLPVCEKRGGEGGGGGGGGGGGIHVPSQRS